MGALLGAYAGGNSSASGSTTSVMSVCCTTLLDIRVAEELVAVGDVGAMVELCSDDEV